MTDFTSTDALLAESGWLLHLAKDLVGEHAAEDLVQDTMLAALQQRPGGVRRLRPWLKTVLRNLAHRRHRRQGQRVTVEQQASREERQPATAEIVERAILHREVVDHVLQLDEPYRTTLLLHYLEQLPLRNVATRMKAPLETTRTRHKRGLDAVRKRLDDKHGSRAAWAAPLLGIPIGIPTVTTTPAAAATASTTPVTLGTILMSTKAKLSAAALVAIAVVLWQWDGSITDFVPETPGGGSAKQQQASNKEAGSLSTADRSPIGKQPGSLSPVAPTIVVTGIVVDEETRWPLAGAKVRWGQKRPLSANEPDAHQTATTDAAGRFRLKATIADPEQRLELLAHATDHALVSQELTLPETKARPTRHENIEIALPPGTRLSGRVIDTEGGPVGGANIVFGSHLIWSANLHDNSATNKLQLFRAIAAGRSAADGRWVFPLRLVDRGKGGFVIACNERGMGWSKLELFRKRTESGGHVVRLQPGASLTVRAIDKNGDPVPGAAVFAEPRFAPLGNNDSTDVSFGRKGPLLDFFRRNTDTNGVARWTGLPVPQKKVLYTLRATGPDGIETRTRCELRPQAGEDTSITLHLLHTAHFTLRGFVRDRSGQPIEGAKVQANYGAERKALTDATGRYEISGLPGDRRPLFAVASAKNFTKETERRTIPGGVNSTDLDFVLDTALPLTGVVIDQHGHPVQRARIRIWDVGDSVQTDVKGAFRLAAVPTGRPHMLNVTPSGSDYAGSIQHMASAKDSPLTLTVRRLPAKHARLEVEIFDSNGRPLEAKSASLNPIVGATELYTNSPAVKTRIGKVTANDLRDGRWSLRILATTGHELHSEFQVIPTQDVVRLRLTQRASLRAEGKVVFADGITPPDSLDLFFASDSQQGRWAKIDGQPYKRMTRSSITLDPRRGRRFAIDDIDPLRPLRVIVDSEEYSGVATLESPRQGATLVLRLVQAAHLRIKTKTPFQRNEAWLQFRVPGQAWGEAMRFVGLRGRSGLSCPAQHPGKVRWRILLPTWGRTNAAGKAKLEGEVTLRAGATTQISVDPTAAR